MKSILHRLYSGDIIPWEHCHPQSERQQKLLRQIEDEEQYFMTKMSADDFQRFQKLSDLYMDFSSARDDHLFSYAFSLGMLLAMDVTKEAELFYHD